MVSTESACNLKGLQCKCSWVQPGRASGQLCKQQCVRGPPVLEGCQQSGVEYALAEPWQMAQLSQLHAVHIQVTQRERRQSCNAKSATSGWPLCQNAPHSMLHGDQGGHCGMSRPTACCTKIQGGRCSNID